MSPANTNKLRFGLWYDFRNPPQWKQPSDRLYNEILEQIVWGEQHGFCASGVLRSVLGTLTMCGTVP
jgi:hypothetical protein